MINEARGCGGSRALLLESGDTHAHKLPAPRYCFWLAKHINVRKCVAGVMLLSVLTILFYGYYVTPPLTKEKRPCEPPESMTLSPPFMDTHTSRGVTSLSTYWIGIRYLMEGSRINERIARHRTRVQNTLGNPSKSEPYDIETCLAHTSYNSRLANGCIYVVIRGRRIAALVMARPGIAVLLLQHREPNQHKNDGLLSVPSSCTQSVAER
ncbi:hypothetical protein EVAR_23853_1 [Eumeta japonica]|uniref:Uncharacterized protein n=1 Tax=Eumeta variegata TaxID=151549 RepID=A0A4C1V4L4_EUMVA|nr:hypothetical protein EVAR_23853_1 [Eumeta japonica]